MSQKNSKNYITKPSIKKFRSLLRHYYLFYIYRKIFGQTKYARKLGVKVGVGCRLYITKYGSEPFLISIGNNVTITGYVNLITHDGSTWLMRDEKGRRYLYQPIDIGNNVFIGLNSTILPGVKIEDNVIVAAGSVVSKSVPSNSIVAGVPAKIIGKYSDYRDNAIENFISDQEINKYKSYRDRIIEVTNFNFKPFLK